MYTFTVRENTDHCLWRKGSCYNRKSTNKVYFPVNPPLPFISS